MYSLLTTTLLLNAQIRDYRTFIEASFRPSKKIGNELFMSILNVHGFATEYTFYGIGVGYDRYSDIALIPVVLDFKYLFAGKGLHRSGKKIEANGFFSLDFGYAFKVVQLAETDRSQGILISPGIGAISGDAATSGIRFSLQFNFKLQEFGHGINANKLALKIGVLLTPSLVFSS
ncbi:MAG: hypothetical protein R2824_20625 [Saprospiraceae bacterium]